MAEPTLILRDIHQPPAPPWWPLAPGWWLVLAALVLLIGIVAWWRRRQLRRQQAVRALFDTALAAAQTPAEQVAAISELLRRAARRRDPTADRLQGEAWLVFLDTAAAKATRKDFSEGAGRLLLDGGFRPDTDPAQVAALTPLARARFLDWMTR